ncbi:MAG TPA: hypothetical protein VFN75_04755 [Pseudonocardiaceae bacterium]|nr:hypothetical protein [Pseudonocardiaceae bacterium]
MPAVTAVVLHGKGPAAAGTHYQNRVIPPPHRKSHRRAPNTPIRVTGSGWDVRTDAAGIRIACVTLTAAARQGFHPLG